MRCCLDKKTSRKQDIFSRENSVLKSSFVLLAKKYLLNRLRTKFERVSLGDDLSQRRIREDDNRVMCRIRRSTLGMEERVCDA
jgi:hypothetical protein